ncbi:MAG: glycosyltransferase [Candidatus Micrarchaeia archaeon]
MDEHLKIAFFTDSFLPAKDGVVTSIFSFKKALEKRGHEVYIFASGNSKTKEAIKLLKNNKNIFIIRGSKFWKYPQYNIALLPFDLPLKINKIQPDIIHAHTPFAMGGFALAIARINKIPVVSTFHTLFTDKFVINEYFSKYALNIIQKYSWKYATFFYNKNDKVIAPSYAIKEVLEKKGIKDVAVIPNGVDLSVFNGNINGSKIRSRLAKKNEKIVLYVGRLSKEKRLEVLFKAARYLKDENIKFVIVGMGPAYSYYKNIVERMNIKNIFFAGFVEEKELPKYYAASDVFCIPSTFETQGLVAIEAIACGKPVVAANKLALKEVIQNGINGEKFKPNDSKDCARKLKKALSKTYPKIRSNIYKYSLENQTESLLNLYKDVINKKTL